MMKTLAEEKPFVYSCSGCSSAAQMANYLAVQLDRTGVAEMSCIAGVGGNVKKIVRTARSGRKIITIDGCPLACSKACLGNHNIAPDIHFELTSFGVSKKDHEDFNIDEANTVLNKIKGLVNERVSKYSAEELNMTETFLYKKPLLKPGILFVNGKEIITEEVINKNQLRAFIDFPYRLYKGNKYYVPQLKKDVEATFDQSKNPAFDFCEARYWLAYKNGRIAGRIAGIINHAFIKTWKHPYVRFGWMDFEEDENIAKALLTQVENWAKEKGMTAVHGPMGFTNFDYAGMLTDGFNQTGTFVTLYNYPYYPAYMQKAGYEKEAGWVEYKIKITGTIPEKLLKAASIVERRLQLKVVRATKKKEILAYAPKIFELINSTYAGLFGMVPITKKQIQYNIRKYLSFIKPGFVSLVLDKDNELAAFGITMPSLSKALQRANGKLYPFGFLHLLRAFRKNNVADLCLVAVRKDLQGKGVNAILISEINAVFIRHGIEYAESNPELEENTKVQSQWDYYETVQHKRRSCFIKHLKK